jgi:hypothetical protein
MSVVILQFNDGTTRELTKDEEYLMREYCGLFNNFIEINDEDDSPTVFPMTIKYPFAFEHVLDFLKFFDAFKKEPKFEYPDLRENKYMIKEMPEKVKEYFDRLDMTFIEPKSANFEERIKETTSYHVILETALFMMIDPLVTYIKWYHFEVLTKLRPTQLFEKLERPPYNPRDFGFKTEDEHIESILKGKSDK